MKNKRERGRERERKKERDFKGEKGVKRETARRGVVPIILLVLCNLASNLILLTTKRTGADWINVDVNAE